MTPRERLKFVGAAISKLGAGIQEIAASVNDEQASALLALLLPPLTPVVGQFRGIFARLHEETKRAAGGWPS
jgi:hypothetical protein